MLYTLFKINLYLCFMNENKRSPGQPKKFGSNSRILSLRVPANKYEHYKKVFRDFVNVSEKVNSNNNVTL